MKSLPEKDFWNNIKTRLSNYTEDPDDDWDDIAAIISPSRYDSRKWLELTQDIVSAIVLVLLLLFTVKTTDSIPVRQDIAGIGTGIEQNKPSGQTIRESETIIIDKQKKNHNSRNSLTNQETQPETLSHKDAVPVHDFSTNKTANTSTGYIRNGNYSNNASAQSGHRTNRTTNKQTTDETIDIQHSDEPMTISPDSVESSESNINTNNIERNKTITLNNSSRIATQDSVENVIKTDSIAHKEPVRKEEQPTKKRTKKFHPAIYFTVSPSLAYQKMTPAKNDAINITELKSDGIFSSNRLGLAIDGGFQIPVTKTIEVYAGLSYYQQNQTITYKYSAGNVEEIEGNPNEDYIIKPGIRQRDFSYAMRNAGVSAGFFYRLKTDKLMHKIGTGLQYQKGFLRASERDTYTNRSSSYLNYQLLYRLELAVNPRTNFYIQPSFTHAIHASESLNEPFTLKPYRAAIGIGMIYRF